MIGDRGTRVVLALAEFDRIIHEMATDTECPQSKRASRLETPTGHDV
jgi:hypothetical protein